MKQRPSAMHCVYIIPTGQGLTFAGFYLCVNYRPWFHPIQYLGLNTRSLYQPRSVIYTHVTLLVTYKIKYTYKPRPNGRGARREENGEKSQKVSNCKMAFGREEKLKVFRHLNFFKRKTK